MHASEGLITLTAASASVAVLLLFLNMRFRSHPPDLSEEGGARLVRGLSIGCASSVALTLFYLMWIILGPVKFLGVYVLMALVGNVFNLGCLIYSLREPSVEGLFVGLLIGLEQVLWILYALLAFTVQF